MTDRDLYELAMDLLYAETDAMRDAIERGVPLEDLAPVSDAPCPCPAAASGEGVGR